jgi:uncharacterized protein YbaR (Trm112 family)
VSGPEIVDGPLACPETGLGLRACSSTEAAGLMGGELVGRMAGPTPGIGVTPTVMVRADHRCAYPVVEGIPVLLVPEQLLTDRSAGTASAVDISDHRYAESYQEMAHYNAVAREQAVAIEASPRVR